MAIQQIVKPRSSVPLIVDKHLGRVVDAALAADYVTLITADHGNLEEMTNPDGTPHVAHTTNLVSCILIDPRSPGSIDLRDGKLADVAPTVLSALDVNTANLNAWRKYCW